jgi:hypothetical protein
MDPGNWATDLQGGALYKYGLLWVVALSSLMAIVLQVCSARLGIVTGKDLAQAGRDFIPRGRAAQLARHRSRDHGVRPGRSARQRRRDPPALPGIPLLWAVCITARDVLLLLSLQSFGMRIIEAFILVLVLTIGACYFIEIFVLPQTRPDFGEMGHALMRPASARRDDLRRDRHHRRDGHAAQSLPPLCARADARVSVGRDVDPQGDPAQHDRLGRRALDRVLRQRVDHGAGGDHVLRQGRPDDADGRPIGEDWIQGAYHTLAPLLGTDRRQHPLRGRAARQRAELHRHRHARRPGR